MWKILLNLLTLGLPYAWKFVKRKWGKKINDDVEEVIEDVLEAVTGKDVETEAHRRD